MKKCLLLVCFTVLTFCVLTAQKQGNIWCFGANAGLNFNSGAPVGFAGVAMNQWEGCSDIADANGNLLFYTDGNSVWNKNNTTMPNGTGLLGGNSSTQAALIVKQPGNTNIYYVFTTDAFQGSNGFKYSIVDMTQQSGLGDVTVKNTNILSICDERVAAVHHANGTDVWVITTTGSTDTIKSFLLTSTGFNLTPVVNVSGITHGTSYQGYLKPSPDESKLAVAYFDAGFDVYDFDRSTGLTSNGIALQSNNYGTAYGVEFSPDGTKLYGVNDEGYDIYQFNLLAGSASAIANSVVVVGQSSDIDLGSLQLAPDGKIYLARIYTPYLGVINNPNASGVACNFVDSGLLLQYGSSNIGLPNIFNPYSATTTVTASFVAGDTSICAGASVNFTNLSTGATSYQWNFAGGTPDTSTQQTPGNIIYQTPGHYNVSLIAISGNTNDTLIENSYINVYPKGVAGIVNAVPDTVCAGATVQLNTAGSSGNIQWQYSMDGINFSQINGADSVAYVTAPLTQTSSYRTVSVNGVCNDTSAPVKVNVNPTPTPPLLSSGDSIMCASDSTQVLATSGYSRYLWNNGATTNYTYAKAAGGYWVTVTDANGCTAVSQHLTINVYPVPSVSIIQQGDTLSSFGEVDYQWYFNGNPIPDANSPQYIANASGNYAIQITDTNGCKELSNNTYVTVAGVSNLGWNMQLLIYPNPVNGQVHIHTGEAGYYTLYNAIGQQVKSFHLNAADNVMYVNDLSNGVYFIANDNNFTERQKLVIAR